MSEKLECPICLDILSTLDSTYTLTKPCNHFYHFTCIKSWSTISSSTCPRCRKEMSSLFIVNRGEMIQVIPKEGDKLADIVISPSDHSTYNQQTTETITNHLGSQTCCICDKSTLPIHSVICPQCAGLYHRSCSDGLNCPLCDEWIDNITRQPHRPKSRITKRSTNDESYYVALVDELQQRQKKQSINVLNSVKCEDEAWDMLDQIRTAAVTVPVSTRLVEPVLKEKKLKRPKRAAKIQPLKLTAESLARLDSSNSLKRKSIERMNSKAELSFTQKLIVQRLLLKPRLSSKITTKLTFTEYTELNKNLSHRLYLLVESDKFAISAINGIIELAERESYLPFNNRKSFDLFYENFKHDNLITRFKECEWNSQINEKIINFINHEIDKTKNKLNKSQ